MIVRRRAEKKASHNARQSARRLLPLWFSAIALAVCACGSANVPTIEATQFAPSLGVDLAHSTRTADGTYFRDVQAGNGPQAQTGQALEVHYTGWLADGTQFDSNVDRAGSFGFTLGARQVIEGWDQGLAGIQAGAARQLIIPPAAGYGASGSGPIPSNAILVFTVRVDAVR